jgi:NAD(P)-dependent dehydrogenase (short-subunit alcohol dehydrogenase family)
MRVEIDVMKLGISVDEYRQKISSSLPQKRLLRPEEIGALAAYLCSEEAPGITGTDITIAMGSLW